MSPFANRREVLLRLKSHFYKPQPAFDEMSRGLRKLIKLVSLYGALFAGAAAYAQNPPIDPNWALPQWYDTSQSPYQNGTFNPAPTSGQIGFTFTFSEDKRATSAAVFDASGKTLIRTLWMNRAYHAGTWGDIWDGKDDRGNQMPGGTYQIKVVSNNISYVWDGIIGNTETDWGGPANLDNTASFPRAIAFANGKGCMAGGYNEGMFATYCFSEATPNTNITPLTRLYQGNMSGFDIATDGVHYYDLYQSYDFNANDRSNYTTSGIVAFDLQGNKYSFPNGTAVGAGTSNGFEFVNNLTNPATNLGAVNVLDRSFLPAGAAVTGVAVQRNGNVLATSHGEYQPKVPGSIVTSTDLIYFWDKTTGAALGSVSVPNPQKIAFDNNNNLWVISGFGTNDLLYEVSGIGQSPMVSTPITGLSNPVSIATSPTTGDLFVADGGTNQQVFEYNTSTYALVSTLGTLGGYGTGASCDPTVTTTKFWFDPGPNIAGAHLVGQNGPWITGISVADNGDLWIMDQTTQRILHFNYQNGNWNYVNRMMKLDWGYQAAATEGDPTRIFGGFLGFNEFHRNYAVPLQPGDPEAPGGNGAWSLVKNWLPCVVTNNTSWDTVQTLTDAFTFPHSDGSTAIMFRSYQNASPYQSALYMLGTDGSFHYRLGTPFGLGTLVEPGTGNYYTGYVSGTSPTLNYTFYKIPLSGYDSNGFPLWGSRIAIGSYTANVNLGDPRDSPSPSARWPSSNGIIPMYDTCPNTPTGTNPKITSGCVDTTIAAGVPVFHLGGLPINGTALQWETMPQHDIPYADGNGTYPAQKSTGSGGGGFTGGTLAQARDNNVFAYFSGNWNQYANQTYHFTDDGMFLGQFGYLPNANTPSAGVAPSDFYGYPPKGTQYTLAPGFSGDVKGPVFVKISNDCYYAFIGDEGYHHGIHEWHITNINSVYEDAQTLTTVP